jgi:succinoglycan biosynthesis transport protein ExoP
VDLHDYLRVVRKRWRTIAIVTALLVAVAAAVTVMSPRVYQARTQLFVSTAGGSDSTQLLQGSSFTQQRVKSYADLVTTPAVLDPVIEELDLEASADALGSRISASVPLDTVLIDVTVDDEDPERAARIADVLGTEFTTAVSELERVSDDTPSPVKVSVVRPPSVPQAPVSPDPVRNIALGLALGLMLGLGVALLRDLLDTSVKSERDAKEVTDEPVLGALLFDPDSSRRPLVVQADPHDPRAEAFRALRTNLQFVDAASHPRSIVFTCSWPGEGKTTTAANLALTMGAAGSSVCLVEGDLRRPRLLHYLGLEGRVGLTNVIIGQAALDDVLQPFGDTGRIMVLGAGSIPPNPSELLGSDAMARTLRQLEDRFDYVIVDAPPLLPVTDAAVLSAIAGGTVVVVGCGVVKKEQLARALAVLDGVSANVLGLVVNRLPVRGADAETYYREGYAPLSPDRSRKERARDRQASPSR